MYDDLDQPGGFDKCYAGERGGEDDHGGCGQLFEREANQMDKQDRGIEMCTRVG